MRKPQREKLTQRKWHNMMFCICFRETLPLIPAYLSLFVPILSTHLWNVEYGKAFVNKLAILSQDLIWKVSISLLFLLIIDYKWVYKVKRKVGSTLDRYKARLVAKGFLTKILSKVFTPAIPISVFHTGN